MQPAPHVFRAPRAFHPPASLLGRGLRRALGDPLRAEAAYWVAVVLLVTGGVVATQWGWLWLREATPPEDFFSVALWYAAAQAVALVAFTALGYAGWKPPVEVTLTAVSLRIRQGRVALEVPRTTLRSLRRLDATEEHRTLRRRAAVRRFVARPYDPLLVLDLRARNGAPQPLVVLGLPPAERARFEQVLGLPAAQPSPSP